MSKKWEMTTCVLKNADNIPLMTLTGLTESRVKTLRQAVNERAFVTLRPGFAQKFNHVPNDSREYHYGPGVVSVLVVERVK